MMPASNQGVGENVGFPDVCNTPVGTATSPITYPNTGSNAMGLPFTPTVFVSMMPGHNQTAKPTMTNGDNAGVAHSSFMQSGGNNCGYLTVQMGGSPAETLANPTQGNNYNCSTDAKLVPSLVNVLAGFDRPAALRLAALQDRLDPAPAVSAWLGADRVGHLRVRRCSWSAPNAAAQCLSRLLARGARALVLDLRGNPGGDLGVATSLAGLFLPAGSEVLRAGDAVQLTLGRSCALPLTVRVDDRTASAAEALTLALQAHGRALVRGAPTHGKLEAARLLSGATLPLRGPGGERVARVHPCTRD